MEKWTANWLNLGRKGSSWRRIITVVPPLHLYHVFCNRSCNCHFSIFPLIVIFVVVTLVANWNTLQQTIRIRGECICSSTSAVPIDVFSWKFCFRISDHVMVPHRTVFFKCHLMHVYPRAYVCIENIRWSKLGKQNIQGKKVYCLMHYQSWKGTSTLTTE